MFVSLACRGSNSHTSRFCLSLRIIKLFVFFCFHLQAAIANARSLDEVQRLEMLLRTGHVPGRNKHNTNVDEEMEDMTNGS